MKKQITITLSEKLIKDLRTHIPQGDISSFISGLVEKGMEEKKRAIERENNEYVRRMSKASMATKNNITVI